MYGAYKDIIEACKRALQEYDRLRESLEYPEVQADKAQYVYTLKRFHELDGLKKNYDAFISADCEQQSVYELLGETADEAERTYFYGELTSLKAICRDRARAIARALGVKGAEETVLCRILTPSAHAAGIAGELIPLMRADLASNSAAVTEPSAETKDGRVSETRFTACGEGVFGRLAAVGGAHKIISGNKGEYLFIGVAQSAMLPQINDSDFKITLFHSSGAGGQNVNKVETAVRVTHVPSGLTVECQDERSQLRNKERALETIKKRLEERYAEAEKKRTEMEFSAMIGRRNSPITFYLTQKRISDTRLNEFNRAFPMTKEEYTAYIDALIATTRS